MFSSRFARHVAARYRKRGLDRTARRMVAFVEEHGLAGKSVLEIGGGVGEVHIELLERGAAEAVNLELSSAYDEEGQRLAAERGLTGRVRRLLVDVAVTPHAAQPADVVVLHRVVCCYPDYERLLSAAAGLTRETLVFSHPPRHPVSRLVFVWINAVQRLLGREFRAFVHPPGAMRQVLVERGLSPAYVHRGLGWQVVGLRRQDAAAVSWGTP